MAGEARVCPHCNGTSLQTVPYAFESGIVSSHGTISQFGRVFNEKTHSITHTATAARLVPPAKKPVLWPVLIASFTLFFFAPAMLHASATAGGGIVGAFATSLLVLAPGVAWPGWIIYQRTRFNREVHPQLMQEWGNSWFCLSCGNIFNPFK